MKNKSESMIWRYFGTHLSVCVWHQSSYMFYHYSWFQTTQEHVSCWRKDGHNLNNLRAYYNFLILPKYEISNIFIRFYSIIPLHLTVLYYNIIFCGDIDRQPSQGQCERTVSPKSENFEGFPPIIQITPIIHNIWLYDWDFESSASSGKHISEFKPEVYCDWLHGAICEEIWIPFFDIISLAMTGTGHFTE